MRCSERTRALSALVLLACAPVSALAIDGYAFAAGFAVDEEGGWSLSALADVGFTESNGVTISAGRSEADTVAAEIVTRAFNVAFRQRFGEFGLRVGAGVWGDPDRLDSRDLELGVDWDNGRWRIGLEAERRDIDLTLARIFVDPLIPPETITASAEATGVGASIRYRAANRFSISLRGRRYDYDRNLNALQFLDFVRLVSPTTLTLAGSLRKHTGAVGIEWGRGESLFGLELSQDRLAVGEFDVGSLTGTWLFPVSARGDLELSAGYSKADGGEGAAYLGVLYFFYGL